MYFGRINNRRGVTCNVREDARYGVSRASCKSKVPSVEVLLKM